MKTPKSMLAMIMVLCLACTPTTLALSQDVGAVQVVEDVEGIQIPEVAVQGSRETQQEIDQAAADAQMANEQLESSLQMAAQAQEEESLSIGSSVIFVAGVAMLGIIGAVVYRQHKRNLAKEEDTALMRSLLDSEMDYAAM
ncbi:Aste57867_16390 [Aphanomyces stellatus]|uniref:Aste57867_16390 protein n=1 Tax=Aphanomyces stellatus TaxID=120398 RepID=A0A485L8J5_9STRA|nr:hypothetical protein As57867_016333 [Aphanomyces stellatus]VFT93166.1 Aste57867_16390 [Aphanomyces stellatus]